MPADNLVSRQRRLRAFKVSLVQAVEAPFVVLGQLPVEFESSRMLLIVYHEM